MKYIAFTLFFSSVFFMSCRQEKHVDSSKSDNYYYSEDNTKILYDSTTYLITFLSKPEYLEVLADVNTFEPIASKYGKDKDHVYYKNIQLINVDRESFYWDNDNDLPKDKKNVYLPDTKTNSLTIVEGADPKTYERHILQPKCLNWYKDKDHYFYKHKITDADRETMNFESVFLPFDKVYIFWISNEKVYKKQYDGKITVISSNLLHDDKHFYYKEGCDERKEEKENQNNAFIIPFKNVELFKFYDEIFKVFRIDDKIYYQGLEIDQADVDTFEKIEFNYFKDKSRVFFKNTYLENSDPKTFDIINWMYAKDKNNVYKHGKILERYKPGDFKADQWGRYPPDDNYGVAPKSSGRSGFWRDDD